MRIYLLNPPYFSHFGRGARWQDTGRGGTLYYPIWLAYATAVLDQEYDVKLVDAPAWDWNADAVLSDINEFKPDIIIIDSSFPSMKNDTEVAESIKNHYPHSLVVIVGPPTSQYPDKILQSPGIDVVARWEYDFTLKELADKIDKGLNIQDIKGISYKSEGAIVHNPNREFSKSEDLDKIPFVSKIYQKYLNIGDYFLGQSLYPEIQIFTGRGCPNHCTFCAWPQTLMGRKYRTRTIENVLDEVEWIEKNINVKEIFFEDDTFTISKKRVQQFCEEYQKRQLNINWSCNARADSLDLDTMIEMKRSNCRLLISGFESGSEEILKSIKKGITIEQIRTFSRNAKNAGLLLHADFIIGLPGETKETIKETRILIDEIKPEIIQVAVASPFPGTEFYEWCQENKYLLTNDPNEYLDANGHQKAIISYPKLSNEEMVAEGNSLLKDYYLSLQYVPLALRQVIRRNMVSELRRLWFSARMFLGYSRK